MAMLIACLATRAAAETFVGRVVGVSDGDTVTVLDAENTQHKIRVAGIDAPEKKQAFGQRSKESMSGLVFGKEVEVLARKRDRYGRLIGKVMVADPSCTVRTCPKTLDAGLAQIAVGMAWWYRHYTREQSVEDARANEFAEQEARARHAGLWRDPDPHPGGVGHRRAVFERVVFQESVSGGWGYLQKDLKQVRGLRAEKDEG